MYQELELNSAQKEDIIVQFDSAHYKERRNHIEESQLAVAYQQHPLRVRPLHSHSTSLSLFLSVSLSIC